MGIYLNPPEEARKGRPIRSGSFAEMACNLMPGEVLVGLYDRLLFKLAPYIPDAIELDEFERQYREGHLVSHEFYAVNKWWE
jgi:hypothetical protein